MRFSRSFCLLLTEFFLSIRTEIPVRSLPLCQILQIFTVNFQRYFRSKYKFCKIFEGTRSLNLHLREPGVLARTRAISAPGRTRHETISSHLCHPLKFDEIVARNVSQAESDFTSAILRSLAIACNIACNVASCDRPYGIKGMLNTRARHAQGNSLARA